MKCSVFICTSADGYIARNDGSVDWITAADNANSDDSDDLGFSAFMSSVDCMIIGRKSMEKLNSMKLDDEHWPYGTTRIFALSTTVKEPPLGVKGKIEMYMGDLKELITRLKLEGCHHAYIDGGATIQSFINAELMNELTITRAPILLGEGIPLFGKTSKDIYLENCSAVAFPNGFIQEKYTLKYS